MKQLHTHNISFSLVGENDDAPDQYDLSRLARHIERYTPHDGSFDLPVPNMHVIKASQPDGIAKCAVSKTGICIVPQGAKRVILGKDIYEYDESRMVVYSSEVPVAASIIKASKAEPYLGLVLGFNPQRLSELVIKAFPHGVPKKPDMQPIYIGRSNPKIVQSALRLLDIINQQEDLDLLVPLVMDEILIRLLRSPIGASIAQIGMTDSNAYKVAKAISWLKNNYAEPIKVEALAERANMSPSSFYHHFKTVTSMSPLQYQKTLRLQEARQLMLFRLMDVSSAGLKVGYSSVSQFSREYSRLFGHSPAKDMAKIRAQPAP